MSKVGNVVLPHDGRMRARTHFAVYGVFQSAAHRRKNAALEAHHELLLLLLVVGWHFLLEEVGVGEGEGEGQPRHMSIE